MYFYEVLKTNWTLFFKKRKTYTPKIKTRKILSPIDLSVPNKDFKDFLFVNNNTDSARFMGIRKGKEFETGVVTLTSEITESDVFSRFIDNSNEKIESVDSLLKSIVFYLEEVNKYKIGNIIAIKNSENEFGFELEKIKDRVSMTKKNKLP